MSLSSVPVVGCRNDRAEWAMPVSESIKRSGGGVSERRPSGLPISARVYQAFRWWGVGTWWTVAGLAPMSLSSVPVVGCRNMREGVSSYFAESIKRSGGGVSEQGQAAVCAGLRVYQAFRWWGVGTVANPQRLCVWSLSSVPVVGCRNTQPSLPLWTRESIKRSGGGVSEQSILHGADAARVYQAFRWWGVGTVFSMVSDTWTSLSSVPVVGCRNADHGEDTGSNESIKRSGGGVSEQSILHGADAARVYQAFRWWGVGTTVNEGTGYGMSLSSVPVVGCRNQAPERAMADEESIKRSGGGVSVPGHRPSRTSGRVYQAFRWWGVGTPGPRLRACPWSLSSVPVVGCRNLRALLAEVGH